MKRLAVIGSRGMLGSDLVTYFSDRFQVTSIDRENYTAHIGKSFDVIINANGNSKRYWANQHPWEDFLASTQSVYKSIFDFPCDVYVYISSPDVYERHTVPKFTKEHTMINPVKLEPYGFHKYLSECIVRKYTKKHLILRCSMMLGTAPRKGPFYDIINSKPLFITKGSRLQVMTTAVLAEIIKMLLRTGKVNDIINVGGMGTFSFKNIQDYFDRNIRVSRQAERQLYEMNVSKLKRFYPALGTSQEYVREFAAKLG